MISIDLLPGDKEPRDEILCSSVLFYITDRPYY